MNTTGTATAIGAAPPATQNRRTRPELRWKDIVRPYSKEEVEQLRGTIKIEYTLARLGADCRRCGSWIWRTAHCL